MRMERCTCILLAALTVLTLSPITFAQDGKMGDDEKAMMDAMIKAGTPGAPHKLLESLVGSWTVEGKIWMNPDQPPMDFQGKSVMKTILGGRFLQEDYEANLMGPFHGLGLTGYDNVKKVFVSTWIDSMTTSIITLTGTYDAATKTFTYSGEVEDPVQGQKTMRITMRWADDKTHVSEFFEPNPEGTFVKTMEMTYKRS